jgi:hypothetical protein
VKVQGGLIGRGAAGRYELRAIHKFKNAFAGFNWVVFSFVISSNNAKMCQNQAL